MVLMNSIYMRNKPNMQQSLFLDLLLFYPFNEKCASMAIKHFVQQLVTAAVSVWCWACTVEWVFQNSQSESYHGFEPAKNKKKG